MHSLTAFNTASTSKASW